MEVILTNDVEKLGLKGEVVDVKRGYARNYLLPRRLAEVATPGRVAEIRRIDEERARHEARSADQAAEIADTLTKTVLRFEVKAGPTGALFGSVTPTDIAEELWRTRKIRVDRRKIDLDVIKRIGRFSIPVHVFEGVTAEVKTLVVPEGGELPPRRSSRRSRRRSGPRRRLPRPRTRRHFARPRRRSPRRRRSCGRPRSPPTSRARRAGRGGRRGRRTSRRLRPRPRRPDRGPCGALFSSTAPSRPSTARPRGCGLTNEISARCGLDERNNSGRPVVSPSGPGYNSIEHMFYCPAHRVIATARAPTAARVDVFARDGFDPAP